MAARAHRLAGTGSWAVATRLPSKSAPPRRDSSRKSKKEARAALGDFFLLACSAGVPVGIRILELLPPHYSQLSSSSPRLALCWICRPRHAARTTNTKRVPRLALQWVREERKFLGAQRTHLLSNKSHTSPWTVECSLRRSLISAWSVSTQPHLVWVSLSSTRNGLCKRLLDVGVGVCPDSISCT